MSTTTTANAEQIARWNGVSGQSWVEAQSLLDRIFEPFSQLLIDALHSDLPSSVLDVGCGTGSTTLAAARRLGKQGRCVGIDVSEPMLALARTRAAQAGVTVSFLQADAQTHRFEPASFDVLISRFGVMFFDDPVAAFLNLRSAARAGARLRFIAWRSAAENPFMTTAEHAAAPCLQSMPARQPDAPGQFAFAKESRIVRILSDSGWDALSIQPIDVVCSFPAQQLNLFATRFGPLGQVLHELDAPTREQVAQRVYSAFEPYRDGAEVRFSAACWSVAAMK